MKEINVALIGCKFMGKAHSNAWKNAPHFFDLNLRPVMKVACDTNEEVLAEFAGHKHLLRVNLEPRGAGTVRIGRSMQSTRCADNDRSNVLLLQGTPRDAQVAS